MRGRYIFALALGMFLIGAVLFMVNSFEGKRPGDRPKIANTSVEIEEMVRRANEELNPERIEKAASVPPWFTMPKHTMDDPIWRMGSAEDLRREFFRKFAAMTPSEQVEYEAKYPEPDGWHGYYDLLRRRAR